jgi:hypothetical protein
MRQVRGGAALVLVSAILGVACGDDDETQSSTASSVAVVTSAASATTEPATTTVVPTTTTTTPATTTPVTTTTGPTTTAGAAPAGWTEVDDLPAWAFPPCCADTWKAPGPSPELPATDDPLEDGVYFVDITAWSPTQPDTMTLAVHRFERCGILAEDNGSECSGWGPDDVYVDDGSVEREFPLDASFEAGMTGLECDADNNIGGQMYRGDGPSLARLWSALEADYDRWVRGPLDTGVLHSDLTVQLAADPASPFQRSCYGADDGYVELVWTDAGGPSLLFQSLVYLEVGADETTPRTPEQLLLPAALEIREGEPVLYLYEGFRP